MLDSLAALQVTNNVLASMAVDYEEMLNAKVMDACVYKTEEEKAAAYPLHQPPPAYANKRIIKLMSTSRKQRSLTPAQRIGLHYFAYQHVKNYAKVCVVRSTPLSHLTLTLIITLIPTLPLRCFIVCLAV